MFEENYYLISLDRGDSQTYVGVFSRSLSTAKGMACAMHQPGDGLAPETGPGWQNPFVCLALSGKAARGASHANG